MRGLVFIAVFVGLLPLVFFHGPFVGILMWYWISLMNPHQVIWNSTFAAIPYALIVAIATIASWLLHQGEPKFPPATKTTVLILVLMVWISITSLWGTGPVDQLNLKWELSEKMLLMTILAYLLTNTRQRLDQLIVVCALSVAFFGVKGGIFSLIRGGTSRVYGPDGTMIGDNNDLGVALTMMLPLLFYIHARYRQPYFKWALPAVIGLTFIGDIFTYSRGALVALCSMGAMLWLRSRHKFRIMVVIAVAAVGVWRFAPPEWTDRMGTIETYQDDTSADSRIYVWHLAWAMVLRSPVVGAGFHWSYDPETVNRELWDVGMPLEKPRAAHSIWFEMLGDHGFVGFAIFIAILASAFLDARWLVRRSQRQPDLLWANNLGRMLQASLIGFCAGGSFATLAMYDGLYAVVIVAAAGRLILAAELASRSAPAAVVGKGFIGMAQPGGALRPQPSG
jgi:putative inorganic carbon (HCO3(-)) transporter